MRILSHIPITALGTLSVLLVDPLTGEPYSCAPSLLGGGGGGGSTVSVTPAVTTGNTIGTITVDGTATALKETVTTLTPTSGITGPAVATYLNESGISTAVPGMNVLTTAQTRPTATGNTANQNSTFKDSTGATWMVDAAGEAVQLAPGLFAQVVYVNDDPATATIFSLDNPPVTNDNALKNLDNVLYVVVSADQTKDGKTWTSNGTVYDAYVVPAATEWVIAGTTTDAGADKVGRIARLGWVSIGKTTHSGGTNPSLGHALEVVSNMQIKNLAVSGAGAGVGLEFNTNASAPRFSFINAGYITEYGVNAGLDAYFAAIRAGTAFRFTTNGGSGQAERFTILSGGNVGVNTATPLSKFDVVGSLGLNINLRGANPYTVAEDDYTVVATTAGAVVNLMAPAAITRRTVNIKNASAGAISIVGHIDTVAATTLIVPAGSSRTFHTNGTTWYLINSHAGTKETVITATAGQTSFTLNHTPVNGNNTLAVQMFRNGVRIVPTAYTVSNTTVTYIPANNGSAALGAMVAGDVVIFSYVA